MAAVLDFGRPAFALSLRALRDLSIRLSGSGLQVGLKGFKGFRPKAFDGLPIVLVVRTDRGPVELAGRLGLQAHPLARGPWYGYTFKPEREHQVFLVLAYGNLFTNVEQVVFPEGRSIRNRFFRAPLPAASCP